MMLVPPGVSVHLVPGFTDLRRNIDALGKALARRSRPKPYVGSLRVAPGGALAAAMRHALSRWVALCRILDDGRIDIANNPVERAIRPIALGRKNHLFAGSDGGGERWAMICSLIATAKFNGVEPYAYLKNVLERVAAGHPAHNLDELLPWNWRSRVLSTSN